MKVKSNLVTAKELLDKANLFNYAVAQVNVCNLEWTKWVLEAAQETNSPIIIGVSESAARYMGGYLVVFSMVNAMVEDLHLTIPVALQLDNGSFEECKKALDAGFTSVMFNGTNQPFDTMMAETLEMSKYCKKYGASLEVEIGRIHAFDDNANSSSFIRMNDALELAALEVDAIAINAGSYAAAAPKNVQFDFDKLVEIQNEIKKPLVLRGVNGFSNDIIKKSISLGINKINIATDLQLLWAEKTRQYFVSGKDLDLKTKGYDCRKVFKNSTVAIKKLLSDKFKLLSSFGVAKD